ncbi:hypothetical protein [Vibrio ouci]|uniref:Uncharacterized protein n=1 Tax=Vibrio ouci TaxID=2499078 RepID=A0A4Y8W8Z6_9VIBR|nr:hypothetical protein [Vibrio ouci]TFH89025.1 hypothetical protein ELS82_24560 [Vibrio ouci]
MNEEELKLKIAENRAKRAKITERLQAAKEAREVKLAEQAYYFPDESTFCQKLKQQTAQKHAEEAKHELNTRRNGRCLDGSLDMTLSENKNKRKYVD